MDSTPNLTYSDIQECCTRLKEFFPRFVEISNEEVKSYGVSQNVLLYYSYAIQYNVQGGKTLRGIIVASTVMALCKNNMTDLLWTQTLTVAWCVELLQTSFLVADDIMDQSKMRRSNTCWYLVPTIGVANAVNDVMFLYTMIYRILFKTLKDSEKLLEILETFNRVSMTTILGQHLDTYESNNDRLFDNSDLAVRLFCEICKNKTSYYSIFLPIKLGMLLSGMDCSNLLFSKVESVSILIGSLFQAQDDYFDCYGDPDLFGKTGTDIQTRKCTWLLTQALTLASEEQKALIKENIGSNDESKVAVVKGVYNDMNMSVLFERYSKELEFKITSQINDVEHPGIKDVLKWCLDLIKDRSR